MKAAGDRRQGGRPPAEPRRRRGIDPVVWIVALAAAIVAAAFIIRLDPAEVAPAQPQSLTSLVASFFPVLSFQYRDMLVTTGLILFALLGAAAASAVMHLWLGQRVSRPTVLWGSTALVFIAAALLMLAVSVRLVALGR